MEKHRHIRKRILWSVVILSLILFMTILIQHENLRELDVTTSLLVQEFSVANYSLFQYLSFLGSIYVVPVILGIALVWLWQHKKRKEVKILAIAVISNYIIVNIIKVLTDWARPQEVQRAVEGTFPSAHASTPFVLYTLAYLFLSKKQKALPLFSIIALAVLIGFSRIIVNAHWLTDVLAGILLAIAWISATLLVYAKR